MGPSQFQQAMRARGFTLEPDGQWHGPFGIIIAGTYNDNDTQGWIDLARNDIIQRVDQLLRSKRDGRTTTR